MYISLVGDFKKRKFSDTKKRGSFFFEPHKKNCINYLYTQQKVAEARILFSHIDIIIFASAKAIFPAVFMTNLYQISRFYFYVNIKFP